MSGAGNLTAVCSSHMSTPSLSLCLSSCWMLSARSLPNVSILILTGGWTERKKKFIRSPRQSASRSPRGALNVVIPLGIFLGPRPLQFPKVHLVPQYQMRSTSAGPCPLSILLLPKLAILLQFPPQKTTHVQWAPHNSTYSPPPLMPHPLPLGACLRMPRLFPREITPP